MNSKFVIAIIIVAIAAIIIAPAVDSPFVLYDPELANNGAAKEIAALGIPVTYEELGQDGNGYTVQGQTWIQSYSDGSQKAVKVILDDDVDPNSYEAYAILYHELGHIVHAEDGSENTEEAADEYAASKGYNIVDAYHGIH